jgi:hypothetical protein
VALVVACAWAGSAAAADEAASAHYKKGRSLYNVSEYRAALEEFKQAYVAHEDPAFLYNIAQCHRQLGNHREAVTFYKRFLAESPKAANRKEIERLISELDAKAAEAPPPAPDPGAPPPGAPPPNAAPVAEPPTAAIPPAAAPATPETHAGLHLELGLGGGGFHDNFNWAGLAKGTATGGSGALQLALTYGLSPRFALGGLFAVESVQSPKVEVGGVASSNVSLGTVGFLGVVGDLRLQPGPTGWHFEAAVGGARMTIKDQSGAVSSNAPAGGAIILGAGYDWALGPNWQLGVLGRFLGGSLTDQFTHDVTAGSLLVCLSRH